MYFGADLIRPEIISIYRRKSIFKLSGKQMTLSLLILSMWQLGLRQLQTPEATPQSCYRDCNLFKENLN